METLIPSELKSGNSGLQRQEGGWEWETRWHFLQSTTMKHIQCTHFSPPAEWRMSFGLFNSVRNEYQFRSTPSSTRFTYHTVFQFMLLLNASDVDPNYPFFYLILRDRTEKAELRGLMGGAKLVPAHQGTMGKNGGSQKVRFTKKWELDRLQRGRCPPKCAVVSCTVCSYSANQVQLRVAPPWKDGLPPYGRESLRAR